MRTQFLLVGLLSGVAGVLVGTAGCDNITAGQSTDSKAPPQLYHIMIQDARYVFQFPNRASALDILDNSPMRPCTITCKGNCPGDMNNPAPPQEDTCINEFLVDQFAPDVHCLDSGICNDPLKIPSTGVPVPLDLPDIFGLPPDMRDPGGGIAIRMVFDKVLDNSIETVAPNGSNTPGATLKYTIMPGLVELDDAAGKPVDSTIYYDNGGSFQYSADLELVPLGPAIVIKPNHPLDNSTTYTVKIDNPGALKDREGNQAVALGGGTLGTSYKFTTEDLTADVDGNFGGGLDYPASFSPPPQIAGNEVIQLGFYELIAGDSAKVTVKAAPAGAHIIAYSERFSDPTMCPMAATGDPSGYVLDINNGSTADLATAQPAEWPKGDYDITVTVPAANGKGAAFTREYQFTVGISCKADADCTNGGTCDTAAGLCQDATDPKLDPNIQSQHVTPAQCMM